MLRLRHAESDEGLVLFNLHMDPAFTVEAKRRLLDSVWRHTLESVGCICFVLDDMNYVHSDEYRVDHLRIVVAPARWATLAGSPAMGSPTRVSPHRSRLRSDPALAPLRHERPPATSSESTTIASTFRYLCGSSRGVAATQRFRCLSLRRPAVPRSSGPR